MSMDDRALQNATAQRLVAALPRLQQMFESNKVKLGREHPSTLKVMANLVKAYRHAGRLADALQVYEQSLPFMIEKFGPHDHYTLGVMADLAQAYLTGDEPEKALPMFDRYIAADPNLALTGDLVFAGMLIAVSAKLIQHHKSELAETYLRQCLIIREQHLSGDWRLFNAKGTLGAALAGQKKFQEAETLLVEGYSGMKEREAKIPPAAKRLRLLEAIQRLVDLYVAWKKPEQAAEWQKQLDQTKAAMKDTETTSSNETTK